MDTAIDEYSHYRILGACSEQSTYPPAYSLHMRGRRSACQGVNVEYVRTDYILEFANRFSSSKRDKTPQRQGGTKPPGRPETFLQYPPLLLVRRLWRAARCPPKSQQLPPHASHCLALPQTKTLFLRCPICLTNLQRLTCAICFPSVFCSILLCFPLHTETMLF